jgi:hypothetical protein
LSALFGPGATLNKKLAFQAQVATFSVLFGPGETLIKNYMNVHFAQGKPQR